MTIVKTCFENWIGVRGACVDVAPGSGKFVDSLPGVSLKMMASLSTESKDTWKKVWQDIYDVALTEIESDFVSRGQSYFKTAILLENRLTGRYDDQRNLKGTDDKYKGVAIEVRGSRYTDIFIHHVNLYTESPITDTLKIYDYYNGQLLDSVDFTTVKGVNTIQVNKTYSPEGSVKKIVLLWDANKSQTVEVINNGAFYQEPTEYAHVRSVSTEKTSTFAEGDITFGKQDHGLIVAYSLNCSVQALMCSVKNLITIPLWYKLGEMLMNERTISERLNYFTLVNMDAAKALRDTYLARYTESIEKVFAGLEVNQDGICYVCNKRRMSKVMLP